MSLTPYLTVPDVAALLRCSERSVRELTRTGRIPHRRVTHRCLFLESELQAWLDGGELEVRELRGGGRVVAVKA